MVSGMRNRLRPLLAASLALALACSGLTGEDTLDVPPRGATESAAMEPAASVLNIPLTVTWAALQESVDAGLPTPLAHRDEHHRQARRRPAGLQPR
jgi:hypothetical protein